MEPSATEFSDVNMEKEKSMEELKGLTLQEFLHNFEQWKTR